MASFCFYSSQLLLKGIWRPSCNNRPRAFLRSLSFPLQSSPSLMVTVQQTNHNSKAIRSPKLIQTLVKIEQPGRIEETKWKGQVLLFGCQTQKSNTNKISFPASPTRNLPRRGWQNRHPRTTTSKMIHNTILTVTPPNPHCVNRRPTWGPALMDFNEKKNIFRVYAFWILMFSDFLMPWLLAVLSNLSAIIPFCSDTKRRRFEYFEPIANK